jgi:3',5'-nucleoside bisphosphate phosphatase
VNRPSFSVFSQLGLLPPHVRFDAIELAAVRREPSWQREIDALDLPVLRSSDAHYLSDIGNQHTRLELEAPTFAELVLAIGRQAGRRVV